jgi:CheY-like chemotaxis protein
VDDEADIRDIICMVLEEHGARAVGAASGREALDLLCAGAPPRLVILDLMMPGMDGWEFRRTQLADPRVADVPVLVLSGDGSVERKAADLRAIGYLSKPFEFEELLHKVERFVQDEG